MRRSLMVLVLAVAGTAAGCCSGEAGQVATRDALLRQIKDNLDNDIGPKYRRYLDADVKRNPKLRENDYGVVTDTSASIARVLSSSAVAPAATRS